MRHAQTPPNVVIHEFLNFNIEDWGQAGLGMLVHLEMISAAKQINTISCRATAVSVDDTNGGQVMPLRLFEMTKFKASTVTLGLLPAS